MLCIPTSCLGIEDGLCKSKPLWLVFCRVGEVILGSRHDSKSPESLIIVSFGSCLVNRHIIVVIADLEKKCLFGDFDILRIASVCPIIDECSHKGASVPPWQEVLVSTDGAMPTWGVRSYSNKDQVVDLVFVRVRRHDTCQPYPWRLIWQLT